MSLTDTLTRYFLGEKLEALVFILPLGLVSVVFGAWLLIDEPAPFERGVGGTFAVLGLLLVITGAAVGYRTPSQVRSLTEGFVSAPAETRVAEVARMQKVNAAWPVYVRLWAVFAIAGLLLRFVTRHEAARGVGVALVFFGGVGLLIDGFAERRAQPYTEALQSSERSRADAH